MAESMLGIQRYFSIATAVALVVTMIVVGLVFRTSANRDLVELTAAANVALANSLSASLLPMVPQLLQHVPDREGEAEARSKEIAHLNAVFADLGEGAKLLKVKVYLPDGETVYSSDNEEIGLDRRVEEHPEVFDAVVAQGEPQSGLSFEESLSAFSGEVFNRDVVETYFPLVDRSGSVIGVLELYTDVTGERGAIDRRTVVAIVGLSLVFALLYFTLVFVVMRHVMAPIRRASSQAAAIKPQESNRRLPIDGMPVELLPLVTAINEALERLDRALTRQRQFTGDAAHELLTPLAVLKANVETMSDPQARSAIQQDIDSISEVVSQLLELAELDALELGHVEPVDFRRVCEEVVAMLAPLAVRRGKAIELTGAEEPVMVQCCSRLLGRAVRNLLENAIAHTPSGTTARLELHEDGLLRVIDRGPGVAVEDRARVFQRFWRGKGRKGPGAGLGLSIVQRIATAFGGTVDVGEAPGGGAEFSLRLPLADLPSAATEG